MLNNLITSIIKIKDNEEGIPVFQYLVNILESEYNTIVDYIDDLYDLLIVNNDNIVRKYLLDIIGGSTFSDLDIWILKNISYLHRIRGSSQSWKKYLKWLLNRDDISEVELYKDEVYEDDDWGTFYDLKSSKVTFCESSCETLGETLPREDGLEYFESIIDVLPIHVSLKTDVNNFIELDSIDTIIDTIGCIYCETICEEVCESVDETNTSINYGYFTTGINYITDSVDLTLKCIATCETTCEDCCETSCECDACELYCESSCEKNQTHGTGAGAGAPCQTQCEVICETACEKDCMYKCEESCQHSCESSCQGSCEIACEDEYCQVGSCQCSHTLPECGYMEV